MEFVKIKIVKCSHPQWWYRHLVGKTVDGYEVSHSKDDYVLTDKWRGSETGYVLKSDCVVVETEAKIYGLSFNP